jgi:hypothetical protein
MKITLPDPRTREGIKSIVRFIVARATSICVVTVINRTVESEEDELRAYQSAGVFIGAHVIGEMVADATGPFVDRQIDELADMLTETKEAVAEIQATPADN